MKNSNILVPFQYLVLCFVCFSEVFSQQIISNDTVWATDQIITESVIIQSGATLTINAGVIVQPVYVDVNGDSIGDIQIICNGKLKILGTPSNQIIFKPYENTTSKSYWTGITISSTFTQDSLRFFSIMNANKGIDIQSPVVINGMTIQYSNEWGVNIGADNVSITGLTVIGSKSVGLVSNSPNLSLNWMKIDSCGSTGFFNKESANSRIGNALISNCGGCGVYNLDGQLSLNNSMIVDNRRHGVVNSSGTVKIDSTDIIGNSWCGVLVAGLANIELEYSSLEDNLATGFEITEWKQVNEEGGFIKEGEPTIRVRNSNIIGNASIVFQNPNNYQGVIFNDWGDQLHLQLWDTIGPTFEVPMGWVYWVRFSYSANSSVFKSHIIRSSNNDTLMNAGSFSSNGDGIDAMESYLIPNKTDKYTLLMGPYPTYSFMKNWSCRLAFGGHQVNNNVNDTTISDFRFNYWGQVTRIDTLVHYVENPNINYSGFQVSEIQSAHSTIDLTKSITILSPANSSFIETGKIINIQWSSNGYIPFTSMSLSTDLGTTWNPINNYHPNDGSVLWFNNVASGSTIYLKLFDSQDSTIATQVGPIFVIPNSTPQLSLNPLTIDFDSISTSRPFNIINAGGGILHWTATSNQSWLHFSRTSDSTSSQILDTAIVNRIGLNPGSYSGLILINSDGGNDTIIANMKVLQSSLILYPTELHFDSTATLLPVLLSNGGGGNIHWYSSPNKTWITINPDSGTFSDIDTIYIQVNRTGLGNGTYNGQVIITSNGGNKLITLDMRVTGATSVDENDKIIPSIYSLKQNWPNPFNPSTTIKYGLPENSFVSLTVCNMLGQQVVVLVNERQESGYHEVVFKTENLPSGLYFYRLRAGNFIEAKKLLLLK